MKLPGRQVDAATAQGLTVFMPYGMAAGASVPWVGAAEVVILAVGLVAAATSGGMFRRWAEAPRDTLLAKMLLASAVIWVVGLVFLTCMVQLSYTFKGEQQAPWATPALVVAAAGLTALSLFTHLVPKADAPLLPAVPKTTRVLAEVATDVYRLYDDSGLLLYTGVTADLPARFTKHRRKKLWWRDVAEARIETYPNRWLALAVEQSSIAHERPVHNVSRGGLNDHGTRGADRMLVQRRAVTIKEALPGVTAGDDVEAVMLAEGVPRDVAYRRVLQLR